VTIVAVRMNREIFILVHAEFNLLAIQEWWLRLRV